MTDREYPSNSQNAKPGPEPRKVEQVVTTPVKSRPKSIGKRLKDAFIGGDSRTAFLYAVGEVIVPQAKEMLAEAATTAFERLIFGESRSSGRRSSNRTNGYTNYARYSSKNIRRGASEDRPTVSPRTRDLDDIVFETRIEAQNVLEQMNDLLEEYGLVSIADLYTMLGWSNRSTHTDQKWGWDDLQAADIRMTRGGYILILPKHIFLD